MSKNDKIKGGVSDDMTPEKIAKRHGVNVKDINSQIKMGIKIEMEHVDEESLAREISLDHLFEIPDYYTRLEKMEKDAKKEGVNENITAYARRMRELAGLADGNQLKTLKSVQEGESSFEGGATFYAKDMMGESLKKESLDNPDKADLDKDGKISDYEEKRGKAIDSATKDKSVNESEEEFGTGEDFELENDKMKYGINPEMDDFETIDFPQDEIEEGENDSELYNLNENTVIVLDFLEEKKNLNESVLAVVGGALLLGGIIRHAYKKIKNNILDKYIQKTGEKEEINGPDGKKNVIMYKYIDKRDNTPYWGFDYIDMVEADEGHRELMTLLFKDDENINRIRDYFTKGGSFTDRPKDADGGSGTYYDDYFGPFKSDVKISRGLHEDDGYDYDGYGDAPDEQRPLGKSDYKRVAHEAYVLYNKGLEHFKNGKDALAEKYRQKALIQADSIGWTENDLPPYDYEV